VSKSSAADDVCPVNIIIPVHSNLAVTRRCLESVLASELPEEVSITVIEDASPDKKVSAYCRQMVENKRVKLLVNEKNLGFVATANRGFATHADADVLLLNSDTEVANDWLARLRACAYRDASIGTVTPFSNNATICSYPLFLAPDSLPDLWDTAALDLAFRSANAQCSVEIPTAVGFCMYIKRECLNQVGSFDEENFGQGYGEECDFSMRTVEKGWTNVAAADVFVFHEGSVSFADQADDRKAKADLVMRDLHPGYDRQVTDFIHDDPLAPYRGNVDCYRLAHKPEDAANIIGESQRTQSAIKQYAIKIHHSLEAERDTTSRYLEVLAESQEHSEWLEKQMAITSSQRQELIRLEDMERHNKAEIESLGKLLQQSREEFTRVDGALVHANEVMTQNKVSSAMEIDSLGKLLQQSREEYKRTDQALVKAHKAQVKAEELIVQLKKQGKEESESLNRLLQQSREEFRQTDEALANAQRIVVELEQQNKVEKMERESLENQLQHNTQELQQAHQLTGQLTAQVEQSTEEIKQLTEQIDHMRQSRSWRYTAWLRRAEGSDL
jgi:O-antigen biosynthesis protein